MEALIIVAILLIAITLIIAVVSLNKKSTVSKPVNTVSSSNPVIPGQQNITANISTVPTYINLVKPNEKYFIRTVTYHCVLEVDKIEDGFIYSKPNTYTWIADSGRFMPFIDTGVPNECEPTIGVVKVSIGSIIDIFDWNHPLLRQQK